MAEGRKTGGRQKGTPNKSTAMLKDAILSAAELAGDKLAVQTGDAQRGTVGYLTSLAMREPTAFATLLGKVLPLQVQGAGEGGAIVHRVEWLVIDPKT